MRMAGRDPSLGSPRPLKPMRSVDDLSTRVHSECSLRATVYISFSECYACTSDKSRKIGIQDAVYRVACILVVKYRDAVGYRSSCRTQGGVSYSLQPMIVGVATVATMFSLSTKKKSISAITPKLDTPTPCWIYFPKKKRSFVRDPDSTEKFQAQRFAAITEISTSEPPRTPPSLYTIPDSSRPPNHVSAFTEWPCPRHAVKAPASSFLTSIGMSWMMCAQMTQGKASLFARVHKITRSSPHLQHSSFYHSPPTSTTKLLRSSSDTMARFSPQQSRPVHATPFMNHSTAPSDANYDTANPSYIRKYLRTYGLTPPRSESYETQKTRCLAQLGLKNTPIDKFLYLQNLRKNNVHLFYRMVTDHLRELTPLIYTPVVGEACQRWSEIYQAPEGMYLSWEDRGNLAAVIANWPQPNVEITCITDGSRILGLGDLGINGMGIPIGKLALYTACAGIRPEATLPLTLDLGTGNKTLREDPLYMGSRRDKISAEEEREFLDELMAALTERWPGIVIQFEDFKNPFPALERYRDTYTCFNDDIQGTGAVILGGVINAVKRSGLPCKDQRAVFFGAGSAGVGVAKQIVDFFVREGMTEDEARSCFYLVDTKGLVTADRGDKLADHKVYFAREDNNGAQFKTLEEVVDHVQPTILMGLSTMGGVFTPEILRKMADWNTAPIIFPLSNPSSKSECDFETAVVNTDGRCLFASGSPFPNSTFTNAAGETHTYYPGQGNNMYVFPGIGLGSILSKAVRVTDGMIYASGEALSKALTAEELERGLLYPDITRIREVSVVVTRNVIRAAQADDVDRETGLRKMSDSDLDLWIKSRMYDPHTEVRSLEREVGHLLSSLGSLSPLMNGSPTEEKPAKL